MYVWLVEILIDGVWAARSIWTSESKAIDAVDALANEGRNRTEITWGPYHVDSDDQL